MRWKFANAQIITIFSQATNCSQTWIRKGFRATGTMTKDRVMKCSLIDMKQMKKKERWLYDYRSDGKIEIVDGMTIQLLRILPISNFNIAIKKKKFHAAVSLIQIMYR